MTGRARALLTGLASLFAVLLGLACLGATVAAPSLPTATIHFQDSHDHAPTPTEPTSERGPPELSAHTTCGTGDHWSHGAPARMGGTAIPIVYNCDELASFAKINSATGYNTPSPQKGCCSDSTRIAVSIVEAGVAAKGVPGRFIGNSAGYILDTTRITIPEGKFGYLLKNPSKSGVFKDSMGFGEAGLDCALRGHLTKYFGGASESDPMTGGGSKFVVRGPMTGPSRQPWDITTAWGVDLDGTARLITATP